MKKFWARLICLRCGCYFEQTTCICTRCGREQHLWGSVTRMAELSFEFIGPQGDGRMRYKDVSLYQYSCSRCGCKKTQEESKILLSDS